MSEVALRTLFPHQREAADAVDKTLQTENRATLVMPCGTGKTRVAGEAALRVAQAGAGRAMVMVPTLELVHQAMNEWAQQRGTGGLGRVVAVCSDREVLSARRGGVETAGVTVDPGRLAELCAGAGPVTVACTYQSLGAVTQAQDRWGMAPVDIAVVDEAHRTAGPAGKPWGAVHDERLLVAKRRLYMTATPRIVNGDPDAVISMSNESIYGPVAYRMSFAQAIDMGLLAPYRLVVAVITGEEVSALLAGDDSYLRVGSAAVAARMLAAQLAVLRAAKEYGIRRLITYHRSVADAKWFTMLLPRAYDMLAPSERPVSLWADYVHGGQAAGGRRRVLNRLTDPGEGLVVVANSRVLTEGFNAPEVDAVCFLSPRGTIDTIQGIGRALRRGDRSRAKTASVLVPVLLEPGQDPATALAGAGFGQVWETAGALASHDDSLLGDLETARRRMAEPERTGRLFGSRGGLPDWLAVSGIPVPDDFAAAVSVRTVTALTPSWGEYIRATELYRREHGNLLVHRDHRTETGLGQWIANLRTRAETLTPQQRQQMDALGMVWDVPEHQLRELVSALRAYKAEYGHLSISNDYVVTRNGRQYKLGAIAATARQHHAADTLHPSRFTALEAEGFIWDPDAHEWDQFLGDLDAFQQAEGHLNIPQKHITAGRKVGTQVNSYRTHPERLAATQRAQLDERGFIWDVLQWRWDLHIEALTRLKNQHGHLSLPRTLVIDTGPIPIRPATWINSRVQEYRTGRLTDPHRIRQLVALGVELAEDRRRRRS
ncbi:Helicase associated domain protein [Streptomyces sp. NPDC020965]|uniref:DEAD/DEAH box helicase n=1 Tax=Streptomyces sp. NPDC020965 TaxID=3365105 RepID=UPI0037A91C2B